LKFREVVFYFKTSQQNQIDYEINNFQNKVLKIKELTDFHPQEASSATFAKGSSVTAIIGAVTAVPSALMAVVTTLGTAISTLSGAAATNTALAVIGGGTLTAGGGGIVAGSELLAFLNPAGTLFAGVFSLGVIA